MDHASNEQQKLQEKVKSSAPFSASTTFDIDTALSLYKLTSSQSFFEMKQDNRCLVGWGNNTVVVAFRGTASLKNALADLQVPSAFIASGNYFHLASHNQHASTALIHNAKSYDFEGKCKSNRY